MTLAEKDPALAAIIARQRVCIDLAKLWFQDVPQAPAEHVTLWESRLLKEWAARGYPL